jgi:phosphatidylglycerophosphatase A
VTTKLYKLIATFFGAGYFPKAPGTAGAILAFIISCLFIYFDFNASNIHLIHLVLIFISLFLGVYVTKALEKEWGHDPSKIVIDEALGIWVTFLLVSPSYLNFFIGLILFRFFDILKPLGIKYFDNKNTASSVMLDDLLAGIYANICLQIIIKFI